MKQLALVTWLSVLFTAAVFAQNTPEDRYVSIYDLIQQADALNEKGASATALAKYTEAQAALRQFQAEFPAWNVKIISFRLGYVNSKMGPLQKRGESVPAETVGVTPTQTSGSASEEKLNEMEDRIRKIEAEKASLEAQLKQAAASQPSADVSKFEEQIRTLQGENEQLKSSLKQQQAAAVAPVSPELLESTKQALTEANRKLSERNEAVELLIQEKAVLQKQVATLSANSNTATEAEQLRQALTESNRKLNEQIQTAQALAREKNALQASLEKAGVDASALKELTATRQELTDTKRKLEQQNQSVAALNREKETLEKKATAADVNAVELAAVKHSLAEANRKLNQPPSSAASAPANAAMAAELAQVRKNLNEANQKMQQQELAVALIIQDKESLQKRLDALAAQSAQGGASSEQLAALQEQARALQAEKLKLEAKLKEALAAQPAGADPREYAKAQDTIKGLQKENQLLRASLEQQQASLAPGGDSRALEQTKKALDEANRKLAIQMELSKGLDAERKSLQSRLEELSGQSEPMVTLRSENDALRKQVAQLTQSDSGAQLQKAQRDLEESNRKLQQQIQLASQFAAEKDALQRRLNTLSSGSAAARELEQSREQLATARRTLDEQNRAAVLLLAEANAKMDQQAQKIAALVQASRKSGANSEASMALKAENDILKKRLAAMSATPSSNASERQLMEARTRLASLQSDLESLRAEKAVLEGRLKQQPGSKTSVATAATPEQVRRIQQLEQERAALKSQLGSAMAELTRSGKESGPADQVSSHLATLRARIDVLEAQPVPYSLDELALMRTSPMKLVPTPKTRMEGTKDLSREAARALSEAQKLFASGELEKAEQKYLQIVKEDDRNVFTLANLASIQMELNHYDAAEKNLKQALAISPDDVFSLSALGNLKFRQQQYDESFDLLSRAAKLDPQNPEVQNFLGVTLSHKGMRIPAETALRKAIQLRPGYGAAHNNLAVIYASQKPPSTELARWHYQKALAGGQPRNPDLEKLLDHTDSSARASQH